LGVTVYGFPGSPRIRVHLHTVQLLVVLVTVDRLSGGPLTVMKTHVWSFNPLDPHEMVVVTEVMRPNPKWLRVIMLWNKTMTKIF